VDGKNREVGLNPTGLFVTKLQTCYCTSVTCCRVWILILCTLCSIQGVLWGTESQGEHHISEEPLHDRKYENSW